MMNNLESITDNETAVITQEIGLETKEQISTYERIIRELQNFMTNTIYENYEKRFIDYDNDTITRNNGKSNIEDVEEQGNNEYDDNIEDWRNDDDENNRVENQENYDDDDIRNDTNENQNNMNDENMVTEVDNNIGNIGNQENDNNNKNIENQKSNNDNTDIENFDENQNGKNGKNIMKINDNTNNKVIQTNESQRLRINFKNGDGKEKIVNKTKNSYIYQERKIRDKEKLDDLIKELIIEESNVLEKGIDEESEDIIKLFRKMERNKLKQLINGYQFAKMIIKEREEQCKRMDKQKAAEEINKKIWKEMPGYSY
ncbi:unnamed protein product [Rhizophagus irregularis]|uniref:Uncharacterized protein n=1 Tax=Rhizophagus irregularis TaxID=588596 RepID=A0A2I1H2V9_9GLOM|nr:hypothetical protein RhiirA4_471320 [Rhizophagus irregularis]CAB4424031.1 unnamed protein product [Rhizophagus irregularis]